MTTSVLVLGAGFGGLELSHPALGGAGRTGRHHADRPGRRVRVRLLEARRDVRQADARRRAAALPRPREARRAVPSGDGSRRSIPVAGAWSTDLDAYDADVLVVALGADYDLAATPGLAEAGNEFYSVAGRERAARGAPVVRRGARRSSACAARRSSARRRRARRRCCCTITCASAACATPSAIQVVMPFGTPIPPSPATSRGDPGGVRRARHRVRARPPRRVARPGRARGRARRRTGACRSTCSSASPCTACPPSSRTPA